MKKVGILALVAVFMLVGLTGVAATKKSEDVIVDVDAPWILRVNSGGNVNLSFDADAYGTGHVQKDDATGLTASGPTTSWSVEAKLSSAPENLTGLLVKGPANSNWQNLGTGSKTVAYAGSSNRKDFTVGYKVKTSNLSGAVANDEKATVTYSLL